MKKVLAIIIALIVVGSGAFYGGIKYQESKNSSGNFSRQNFQNLSEEQRQQISERDIRDNLGQSVNRGADQNLFSGEVITKDEESLTLKMIDGGSKIIFFSDSTEISKTTDGSIDEIEIGKQIMISGEQNSDGSYTAKIIQLSPHYPSPKNNE